MSNLNPTPEKPVEEWVTGDEPLTGPQRSYLETLAREAGEEVPDGLSKAEASQLIDRLQRTTGRGPDESRDARADDGKVQNEDEVVREFPHGDGRPLREQMPLTDEDGADIRQYTGEPVETEDGWVLPQQMVTGSENVVGGGEFPNTPGRADDDD